MTRVGLVGPGGIGLFFGGHLEAAGRRVEVASRQPFERYVIMSDEYPVDIPAVVYTDPGMSPQGPMDVVLVTVNCTRSPPPDRGYSDGADPRLSSYPCKTAWMAKT